MWFRQSDVSITINTEENSSSLNFVLRAFENREFDICIVNIVHFLFSDLYEPTGEILGNGAYASVRTYRNLENQQEYAVKVSTGSYFL